MPNISQKSTSKVRFGIIGTNFIVDWVIEAARLDKRFELTAIYSRTQEQADLFAQKHNIPHRFTSLQQMAESPLINAVYIASPTFLHTSQSILFMKHGKHVLCEKPFASNAKEIKTMIEAARNNNVTLMEAMKSTLTPNFQIIRNEIKNIGTIRRYFASYCQYSSRYDKLKAGEIPNAFNLSLSNGAIMDLGIYTIYPMVILFSRPNTINATGLKLSTGVDGQGTVNFEYDEMNATVLYSKIADSSLASEIQGEDGTITIDKISSIQQISLHYRKGQDIDLSFKDTLNEYYYEIAEFINLIENNHIESSINSHENSLITMEIIDEIRKQIGVEFPADNI
jgi:predicted dehydrogenase